MKQIIANEFYGEAGYLLLLEKILNQGVYTPDRTGTGCKKLFNQVLKFDLKERFPASTVRNTPLRFSFEEFWMFLKGITDTKYLEDRGIDIWKPNTTREFLDSRGLKGLPEGSMGKAYGYQLRNFNGIDQLKEVIDGLVKDPFGRRHVITMWNASELKEMALTPCWWSHQFHVEPGQHCNTLHLTVYSRSADTVFGTPFNYQQYGLYLTAVAQYLGYMPGTLTCNLADAHIYSNQIEYAREIITREISEDRVTCYVDKFISSFEDLVELKWEDFKINGLKVNVEPFKAERPPMAV